MIQGGNVHQRDVLQAVITAQAVDQCVGGVHGGDAGDAQLHGLAAQAHRVALGVAALGAGGEHIVHQTALQQVHDVGRLAGHGAHLVAGHHVLVEPGTGAGGAVQLVAHALELPGDVHELRLVAVLHGEDAAGSGAGGLEGIARADQALEQGVVVVGGNAQHLAGGLHLRAELGVHAVQLFKAEHRHLDGHIGGVGVQAGAVAHIDELLAQAAAHGQIHHGHTGDLGDVRHGTGGTGVHLDDVHLAVGHGVLHVDQTGDMQLAGKAATGLPAPSHARYII